MEVDDFKPRFCVDAYCQMTESLCTERFEHSIGKGFDNG